MNRTIALPRTFRLTAASVLVLAAWGPGQAWAQTTEERIQQLEEQLKAVTQELKALKEQVAKPPPPATAVAPAPASATAVPAPAAPTPTADTAAIARKAESDAAAANEKADKLEQQLGAFGLTSLPDGVGFQDPRGRWSLRLNGRVQGDYRWYDPGIYPDGFSIRRARLGATFTYLTDYAFRVEGEYASGNAATGSSTTTATYMYLAYSGLRPYATFILGQSKPQFGLENTGSASFTDFLERGATQNLIQTLNYDRGIMISGTPWTGFNYGVSLTNGTGLNTDERVANNETQQDIEADSLMFTARITENFAALLARPDMVIHLGANYKSGEAANTAQNPFTPANAITEGRGVTYFTPQSLSPAGTTASNVDREYQAYELALAYGPFKLQSEYWKVNYSGDRSVPAPATSFDLGIQAYYVNLMWMITGESYADIYRDGQFGRMRPRNNFDLKNRTWGAWEVGARYSEFDASDFALLPSTAPGRLATTQTAPVTVGTNKAKAYTLGLKWLLNPDVRLMLNYVHTEFDTPITSAGIVSDKEDAVTFRGQIDF